MKQVSFARSHSRQTNMPRKKIDIFLSGKTLAAEQIIQLNNLFLTPGFHSIMIENVAMGRMVVDIILTSLNYYQQIACITANSQNLPAGMPNLFHDLTTCPDLDLFFLEQFYADFIWIEEENQLIQSHLFRLFKQRLVTSGIYRKIPVISLIYRCAAQR